LSFAKESPFYVEVADLGKGGPVNFPRGKLQPREYLRQRPKNRQRIACAVLTPSELPGKIKLQGSVRTRAEPWGSVRVALAPLARAELAATNGRKSAPLHLFLRYEGTPQNFRQSEKFSRN